MRGRGGQTRRDDAPARFKYYFRRECRVHGEFPPPNVFGSRRGHTRANVVPGDRDSSTVDRPNTAGSSTGFMKKITGKSIIIVRLINGTRARYPSSLSKNPHIFPGCWCIARIRGVFRNSSRVGFGPFARPCVCPGAGFRVRIVYEDRCPVFVKVADTNVGWIRPTGQASPDPIGATARKDVTGLRVSGGIKDTRLGGISRYYV